MRISAAWKTTATVRRSRRRLKQVKVRLSVSLKQWQNLHFIMLVRMNDGNVLRVATETGSVLSIVQGMLPIIAVMVVILFVICTFLGRLLTDSLLRRLNRWLKTWIMSMKLRFIRRWNHLLIRFADSMKIF